MNIDEEFEQYWKDTLEDYDEEAVEKITPEEKEFIKGFAVAIEELKVALINAKSETEEYAGYKALVPLVKEVGKDIYDLVMERMDDTLDDYVIELVESHIE